MLPFQRQHIVSNGPSCTIWREPTLLGVQIRGRITEVESNAWRRALSAECNANGYPRFLAFDMAESTPTASPANRAVVAMYLRQLMKHVEWAALHTRMAEAPVTVVTAVLRLVNINNVTITRDDPAFVAAVEAFRRQERPR